MRGYFGVAAFHTKREQNVGGLLRSAHVFGATFVAVIGGRWRHQNSDTMRTPRHVPLFEYDGAPDFWDHLPADCDVVGVEVTPTARDLTRFCHPERAVYLLGPENGSLEADALGRCAAVVRIPGSHCLNLATAGSIVMYDRVAKTSR